jgi:hypothetical protein
VLQLQLKRAAPPVHKPTFMTSEPACSVPSPSLSSVHGTAAEQTYTTLMPSITQHLVTRMPLVRMYYLVPGIAHHNSNRVSAKAHEASNLAHLLAWPRCTMWSQNATCCRISLAVPPYVPHPKYPDSTNSPRFDSAWQRPDPKCYSRRTMWSGHAQAGGACHLSLPPECLCISFA